MAVDFDSLVLAPCMAAFGQSVVYTAQDQTTATMLGVFDRFHVSVEFDKEGAPVSIQRPVLGVQESAFPAGLVASQGDTVAVAGTVYEIIDTQPDGHGHVLLILKRAAL